MKVANPPGDRHDPGSSQSERERALARECAYLRRKIVRLSEQRLRQERIDDINRHFLKRTNDKLLQYQELSRQESLAKSDFLANVSHEIRTPLNIILGMANLLADTELDQTQAQYLHSLRITGRQLLEILNNILEFSRIEAGRSVVEPEPFSLHEIINRIETSALPLCMEKNLYFSSIYDPTMVMERVGDPLKIFQILLNLVNNAVKFTSRGSITLHLCEEFQQPDTLLLSVTDTGIGIPADQLESIFDRFSQSRDSLTEPHGGAGLGLAISQKLSRAMGGDLSVRSAPGRGATFTCRLPLPPAPPAERHLLRLDTTPIPPENFPAASLLVVDDIQENINVIRAYLHNYPVEVASAGNGEEALAMLAARDYPLVLMDIRMPVMDGITATRQIRRLEKEDPEGRQHTIVAITAHAFQEQKSRFLEAGFNAVLTKPFFKKELLQTILRFLDKTPERVVEKGNKAIGCCFEEERHEEIPAPLQGLFPEILAGLREGLEALGERFNSGDISAVCEGAHGLRGLAGMYGFRQLAELLADFSDSVRQGNAPVASELLKALERYLQRLKSPAGKPAAR